MNVTIDWADELGQLLHSARIRADLGQRELAARLGQPTAWLDRLEWGEFSVVDSDLLARLVEELQLDPMTVDGLTGSLIRDVRPGFRSYLLRRRRDRLRALIEDWHRRLCARIRRAMTRVHCGLTLTGAFA